MTSPGFLNFLYGLGVVIALGLVPIVYLMRRWSADPFTVRDWTTIIALLLLAGILTRITIVSLTAGLGLIAIGMAWAWHCVILADVSYHRRFDRMHLFPGEATEVVWTIRNDKPLPISWLRWREAVPVNSFDSFGQNGIQLDDIEVTPIVEGRYGLDELTSLSGFETLVKTSRVRALRRGYYRFGPTEWQASDALGLFTATGAADSPSALTVYPRLFDMEELQLPTHALIGDIRRRFSLIEDPSRYRGAREYRPGDPMKLIDWKATGRTNQVQVKTFDPTVHLRLMLLVSLHSFQRIWEGMRTEYMEDLISTAASIARWALQAGFEVGIHSNGLLGGGEEAYPIMPSAGDDQLFVILDYLARLRLFVNRSVEDILRGDLTDLPHGTTTVICANVVTQSLIATLGETRRSGHVALVLVDNEASFSIPNVSVMHAHRRRDSA